MSTIASRIGIAAVCVLSLGVPTFGVLTNGGFESGMTGWTSQYTQDGSNSGYSNQLYTTSAYHFSGQNSLYGYAYVVGDSSYWAEDDWSRTYAWSAPQDLRQLIHIQLYLAGFSSNTTHFSWGYGQEVWLVLSDGTHSAQALLIDNHEPDFGSLVDRGLYSTAVGNDGRTWYRYQVEPTTTYFGGISSVDLSNARVGVMWEALSWHSSPQTLWAGAYVDDISLKMIPEPLTAVGFLLGGTLLALRRRT